MLGKADRAKLDQYTTSIAEVEKRIRNQGPISGSCAMPTKSNLTDDSPYQDRVPVMLELMALALQCDVTRVVTFMFARSKSTVDFAFLPSIGATTLHHQVSDHGGNAAKFESSRRLTGGRWSNGPSS